MVVYNLRSVVCRHGQCAYQAHQAALTRCLQHGALCIPKVWHRASI